MSGFSAAWLGLRESADHAARSTVITALVADRLAVDSCGASSRSPLRVVDLASGTGSNPRYLAQHLPAHQDWTLIDADDRLLSELPVRMAAWATRSGLACLQGGDGMVVSMPSARLCVRLHRADISRFPIAKLAELRPALITASALLDLVSDEWLANLASSCREVTATVLFALSYDGRTTISPSQPDDELVLALVNRHQVGDKGFGPALGPQAAARAALHFENVGYEVRRERSDWSIAPSERTLQQELIGGWAAAACEIEPAMAERVVQWQRERLDAAAAGTLVITVGHEDLAAWPRDPSV